MKDRQDHPITGRIEKLVDVPGGRQRPGFRLSVSYHCGNDQFGIIERSSARVREHIAELSTFMDRSRRFGSAVTSDPARKRKLFEELPQAIDVLTFIRINLGVGFFEIRWTDNPWCAVSRAR
jgi:hypothetical protein